MRGFILSLAIAVCVTVPVKAAEQTALNTISLMPTVQPGSIPLSSGVKDLGDIVKHLKRSLNDMRNECTRTEETEIVNPWFADGSFGDPYYAYDMMYPWTENPPI